jgi:hypothetical protein
VAPGFDRDISKLRKQLSGGVKRAVRGAGKTVVTTAGVAETVTNPGELLPDLPSKLLHRGTVDRLRGCTIPTRAHLVGMADLLDLDGQGSIQLSVALLRLRVERPDGEAELCVRQHVPGGIRRLAVGSSLRALAHEQDRRIAVVDWKATAALLGRQLDWATEIEQYAWPDPDEWPAAGVIEVRDNWRHRRRIEKRRGEWQRVDARLLAADSGGGRVDSRARWKLELDVGGRRVAVKERVPALAFPLLVQQKPPKQMLGGLITTMGTEVVTGTRLAALVSPAGDLAVDWEATLNVPEVREHVEV